MNITDQLRAMGLKDDAIAGATVNGKPLSEVAGGAKQGEKLGVYRSKWEAQFAMILEDRKATGEIDGYAYERIRLRIGKGTWYKPDFLSWHNGCVTFYEVKGFRREAAIVRYKAAVDQYPFFRFEMWSRKGGTWTKVM